MARVTLPMRRACFRVRCWLFPPRFEPTPRPNAAGKRRCCFSRCSHAPHLPTPLFPGLPATDSVHCISPDGGPVDVLPAIQRCWSLSPCTAPDWTVSWAPAPSYCASEPSFPSPGHATICNESICISLTLSDATTERCDAPTRLIRSIWALRLVTNTAPLWSKFCLAFAVESYRAKRADCGVIPRK